MAGKIIESTNLLLLQFHEFSFKKKSIYIVHYATVYPILYQMFCVSSAATTDSCSVENQHVKP